MGFNCKPKGIFRGALNITHAPKFGEIRALLGGSNLNFLCLSETRLHDSILPSMTDTHYRAVGRGGGVLIYIKDLSESRDVLLCDNI